MPSKLCLACGQDTPTEELVHGYCERCYREVKAEGGVYGKNTVAMTIVSAMQPLGACSVTFYPDGILHQVIFHKAKDR